MRNLCCIAVILEMMENDPIFSIKRDVYDPGWNGTICKELTVTFGVWNWKTINFYRILFSSCNLWTLWCRFYYKYIHYIVKLFLVYNETVKVEGSLTVVNNYKNILILCSSVHWIFFFDILVTNGSFLMIKPVVLYRKFPFDISHCLKSPVSFSIWLLINEKCTCWESKHFNIPGVFKLYCLWM